MESILVARGSVSTVSIRRMCVLGCMGVWTPLPLDSNDNNNDDDDNGIIT